MKLVLGSSLIALALAFGASPSHAAKCTDTTGFDAAQEVVDAAAPCQGKRGQFVKKAKKALKGTALSKPCQKRFMKERINQSTCGRGGFICCQLKGKASGRFVKKEKRCKAPGKICSEGNSVGTACTPSGDCVTTTTTTTTTTSTSTTTTTLPEPRCGDGVLNQEGEECDLPGALCPGGRFCRSDCTCEDPDPEVKKLDFITGTAGTPPATCGQIFGNVGATPPALRDLTCGGLNLGAGQASIPEGVVPDGATSRFTAICNTAGDCQLSESDETGPGIECTDTGCYFGPPLPIQGPPNVCVVNTLREPASGSFDRNTGAAEIALALTSEVVLDPNMCPFCVDGLGEPLAGSAGTPLTGTCDRGPRAGLACTTYNSTGLAKDCPPDPAEPGSIGDIKIPVTLGTPAQPLTTGTLVRAAEDGIFCPDEGQGTPGEPTGTPGCFGTLSSGREGELCRAIKTTGVPAPGPVALDTAVPATLVSIFCVPKTNSIADFGSDLPGPGQVSLPGTVVLLGE